MTERMRVIETFKTVKGMRKSLALRREKDYDWKLDEFGRFHEQGVRELLHNESWKLRDYWKGRIRSFGLVGDPEDAKFLFEQPYWWVANECFTAIGKVDGYWERIGAEIFFPQEEAVRMLVLLTEEHHTLSTQDMVEAMQTFRTMQALPDYEEQYDMLVTALNQFAITKLIDSLGGQELAELLRAAWRVETGFKDPRKAKNGTVLKIVDNLYREKLELLADYCVLSPYTGYEIIPTLEQHGGEKGPKMAEHIITSLKKAAQNLKRTLTQLGKEDMESSS